MTSKQRPFASLRVTKWGNRSSYTYATLENHISKAGGPFEGGDCGFTCVT